MKILVPFNNRSSSSRLALDLAKEHARGYEAEVLVATSADPTKNEKDLPPKEEAEKALSEVEKEFEQAGIPCSTHLLIRGYSRGEDLVLFAREKEVDEIIVGVEKKSRVGKFFLGSVAQHLILKAPCPVVSVKSPQEGQDVYLGSTSMES